MEKERSMELSRGPFPYFNEENSNIGGVDGREYN